MPIKVSEFDKTKETPSYVAIKGFLDKAPVGVAYTPEELLVATGIASANTLYSAARVFDLSKYRFVRAKGAQSYWGNPVAIVALKKKMGCK